MKFADPQSVTCSGCGKAGQYPVKSLLALEATCSACDNSLADAGGQMHRLLQKVYNFVIAVRLTLEIEDLDKEIVFDDAELEGVTCLSGLTGLVERKFAALWRSSPQAAAASMVENAVAKVFPGIAAPDTGIPLEEAFPAEARSQMWNGWACTKEKS
jgi:hypothetical protein